MPRPWHLGTQAQALEHLPSSLGMHKASQGGRHPRAHFRSRPQSAIRRRSVERPHKCCPLGRREEPRTASIAVAPVTEDCRVISIVALGNGPQPIRAIAGGRGHLCGG
jgi:hypothetical protein